MTDTIERLSAALTGRYTVERELGAGGMATVYLAHDVRHDRKVALKVLRPDLAAVIGAERFLAEIKTTANLQHPHILPLHDSGEVDGTVFYVMPFVEGESLRDRLSREKQLPVSDAVRITSEVAGALHYAHRKGIIHRDIKPENILLHDGQALVADFGIALAAKSAGGVRLTETGMSLGTPQYMSPEQATAERDIDARSDIYALGAVTYEMLAGQPPFSGPNAQSIIAKLVTEVPRRVGELRTRVSPGLDDAVMQALEKLPADRFQTAKDFSQALSAGGARAGVVGGGRVRSGVRRYLVLAVTAVAAVVAGIWLGRFTAEPTTPGARLPRRAMLQLGQLHDNLNPFGSFSLARDGGTVVFRAGAGLAIRRTQDLQSTALAGTDESSVSPFVSWLNVRPRCSASCSN